MTTLATEASRRYGLDGGAAARIVDLTQEAVSRGRPLGTVVEVITTAHLVTTEGVDARDVVRWISGRVGAPRAARTKR